MQTINNSDSVGFIVKYNSHMEIWISLTVDMEQWTFLPMPCNMNDFFFVFLWTKKKTLIIFTKKCSPGGQVLYPTSFPGYGTMFLFLAQIAPSWRHISALIHARVMGSRVDVVTLCDGMVRAARFCCRLFPAMTGNKAEKKNQGSSMDFYALI